MTKPKYSHNTSVVTVNGMGAIINNEMEIIRRALESYGYTVEIDNDNAAEWNDERFKQHMERIKELNKEKPAKVILVAEHMPWGG